LQNTLILSKYPNNKWNKIWNILAIKNIDISFPINHITIAINIITLLLNILKTMGFVVNVKFFFNLIGQIFLMQFYHSKLY
jgi:hypothetical protein